MDLKLIELKFISTLKLLIVLFHLKSSTNLKFLSISVVDCFRGVNDIYKILFGFSNLKYLKFRLEEVGDEDIEISMAHNKAKSSIESLVIRSMLTLDELIRILSFTPKLVYLQCHLLIQSFERVESNSLICSTHLTQLNLIIKDLNFDLFESYFITISAPLRSLILKLTDRNVNYLDGDRWERLIANNFPSLEKFIFSYINFNIINDGFGINSNHGLIRHFTSPFLISKGEIKYAIRPHPYT